MDPQFQNFPAIVTPGEAAALFRVNEQDIFEAIAQGDLPAAKLGQQYRIRQEDLKNLFTVRTLPAHTELHVVEKAAPPTPHGTNGYVASGASGGEHVEIVTVGAHKGSGALDHDQSQSREVQQTNASKTDTALVDLPHLPHTMMTGEQLECPDGTFVTPYVYEGTAIIKGAEHAARFVGTSSGTLMKWTQGMGYPGGGRLPVIQALARNNTPVWVFKVADLQDAKSRWQAQIESKPLVAAPAKVAG